MAEKSTFIKIDRKILEWEYYGNVNTFKLFIHLLLTANVKDKKWEGITIKRGELVTSLKNLSQQTGLTLQQVRTALDNLISTKTVTNNSHSKFRIISIKNYDSYQSYNKVVNKQITNKQQTNNKQVTTTKEYKEYKEYKEREEEESFSVDENVPQAIGGKLGKGVLVLSDNQFEELLAMMPLDVMNRYCEKLTDWIIKNKRVCKNHFDIIKKWYEEDYGGAN